MTCIKGVLGYMCLVPCLMGEGELSAEQVAHLFFENIVRTFGLPDEVLHNRDPSFTAHISRQL